MTDAPGSPGIAARWTSSAKTGVGTALSPVSRVWFTLSHGILNEIYYPRIDQACTRDLGLIVTDGGGFFSEEKRDCSHEIDADGRRRAGLPPREHLPRRPLPHRQGDPRRSRAGRWCCSGSASARCKALTTAPVRPAGAAPGQRGAPQHRLGRRCQGRPMLFAERDGRPLALACYRAPRRVRPASSASPTAGSICTTRRLTGNIPRWRRQRRPDRGDRSGGRRGRFVLALGFGRSCTRRRRIRARCEPLGLRRRRLERYTDGWRTWQRTLLLAGPARRRAQYLPHQHRRAARPRVPDFPGGMIASLSIPWGFTKGDGDLGGYHLVWPRDLVRERRRPAGGGRPRKAPRAALPARDPGGRRPLAAEHVAGRHALLGRACRWTRAACRSCWWTSPGARRARRPTNWAGSGPWSGAPRGSSCATARSTRQDRWEEDPGYSPFTLAVEIGGAAGRGRPGGPVDEAGPARGVSCGRPPMPGTPRSSAGSTSPTPTLARGVGRRRLLRPHRAAGCGGGAPRRPTASCRSRTAARISSARLPADLVSPDALALVRFGLRAADDPRIVRHGQGHRRRAQGRDCPAAPAGVATTATATASTRTAARSTAPAPAGLAAADRRARALRARRRPAGRGRGAAARRSIASPTTAACCPSRSGTAPTFPERELFFGRPSRVGDAAGLGARRVYQAAAVRWRRRGSSTCRPSVPPLPGRRGRRRGCSLGGRTGAPMKWRPIACCGSNCRNHRWCAWSHDDWDDAPRDHQPTTPDSACMWWSCRQAPHQGSLRSPGVARTPLPPPRRAPRCG